MGETTAISWADATISFWMGCTAISPACDGCYARALVQDRFGKAEWGGPGQGAGTRVRTSASTLALPFKLQRRAEKDGTRPFVFVNSLADIFDNAVPPGWRRDAFDVMRRTPRLVYLLLTKRPQNIVKMSDEAGGLPPNAALGTTCEDQARAVPNLAHLELARLALRPLFTFGSFEPLLGPIAIDTLSMPGWVITGGETDQGKHRARPTHPDWFRSLRDQCAAAGVPFHHKQNGEWSPVEILEEDADGNLDAANPIVGFSEPASHRNQECLFWQAGDLVHWPYVETVPAVGVRKIGKAASGRLIDGVLHDARPPVPEMEAARG